MNMYGNNDNAVIKTTISLNSMEGEVTMISKPYEDKNHALLYAKAIASELGVHTQVLYKGDVLKEYDFQPGSIQPKRKPLKKQ